MRCDARQYARLARHGPATAVSVRPTGTAVEQYQVSLGNRHSLREAGVIGLPSWSEKATQTETWVKVPRLSTTCPRRVVAFDGGRGDIDRCMEFGDEFGGSAVDAAKWTSTPGSGTITVSGGTARLVTSSAVLTKIKAKSFYGENSRYVTRYKVDHVNDGYLFEYFGAVNTEDTKDVHIIASHDISARQSFLNADATYSFIPIIGGLPENTYFRAQLIRATTARWTIDSRAEQVYGNNYPNGASLGPFFSVNGNPTGLTVDYIFVTKWVAAEPLAGTAQPTATNRALCRPLSASRAMQLAVAG